MTLHLIILAAGKGTRMQSDLPKVLHKIAGAPMLHHAMASGAALDPASVIVVGGHGYDAVADAARAYDDRAIPVLQAEQKGTGHAVAQARDALADAEGTVLVLYGDTPFIRPDTLRAMVAARAEADVIVLGFHAGDPGRYGRLKMSGDDLQAIVEYADASDEERDITFCNSGVIAADVQQLFALVEAVDNANASGEYYLTDIVALARQRGLTATAIACDEAETMGINSRAQLAEAEAAFQQRARAELLDLGVTMQAPDTIFLSFDTVIGRDVELEPNIVFGPGVTIESGALIRAFSHLEGCHVSRGAKVGPYARLRPGAELAEDVHIGNFVEVKNAQVAEGAKINHLSYIGDASVGRKTNIGAGTITCNYNGVFKNRTEIGDGAFIGSNTLFIAPVTIAAGAVTGSGTVVTEDVGPGDLVLSRTPQENKIGRGAKLMAMLRARKMKRTQ